MYEIWDWCPWQPVTVALNVYVPAVVGVPDKHFGEELCAWIVVKDGTALDDATVREYCKGRIAHYKVPKYIRFVDAFPTTVTGKIQKYLIRKIMSDELGLQEQHTA